MPGILPMKVIKVGNNAQSRIAQACDRCRSKKIRCDGIRPSCSQCINVGFECKTSDKLSRRAFPRGYTESLEERVRQLESEVRELKELLDEKDEKIDILTRIHSHSPQSEHSPRRTSVPSPMSTIEQSQEPEQEKDEVFKVLQSPILLDDANCDAYFMGTSSGRTLIESFKNKVQATGRGCGDICTEAFFTAESKESTDHFRDVCFKAPPRLLSDQLINIFFQEWAPLFPVLHRPTFLGLYEEYVATPDAIEDRKSIAQLNLVFGIAALSANSRNPQEIESFESQWQAALDSNLMDGSLATLQCLILAQMYCIQKADYSRLLQYKGLAISLSQRLGLHQSQKRFALGALTSETRKKVFWTLYTLDCFSAAQLGLPTQLKDDDVHCEYPVDADDEYVTEKGFMPTLPGEFTKLSSALALFRAARILSKVLKENYPTAASHELSFRKIAELSDELDTWSNNLAPHLRLQFVQDKPSTNVISSRCPILSLAYHYIRSLVYRPAVCASSALGDRASTSIVALSDSSKSVVQILELLEERGLSFSFCVNRNEVLILSSFGLLFQFLDLDQDGKLVKDTQRQLGAAMRILDRESAPGVIELKTISSSIAASGRAEATRISNLSRHNSEGAMVAPRDTLRSTHRHFKAIVSRFTPSSSSHSKSNRPESPEHRRATMPALTHHNNPSAASISSIRSEPPIPVMQSRSEPALSPLTHRASIPPQHRHKRSTARQSTDATRQESANSSTNLDYLSFGPETHNLTNAAGLPYAISSSHPGEKGVSSTDWERLLGSLDNGQTNIYDTIYGGPPADALLSMSPADAQLMWPGQDTWGESGQAHSVLSFSDESLTSGEDFADFGVGGGVGDGGYRGIVIPELSMSPRGDLVGLDGNFGL